MTAYTFTAHHIHISFPHSTSSSTRDKSKLTMLTTISTCQPQNHTDKAANLLTMQAFDSLYTIHNPNLHHTNHFNQILVELLHASLNVNWFSHTVTQVKPQIQPPYLHVDYTGITFHMHHTNIIITTSHMDPTNLKFTIQT